MLARMLVLRFSREVVDKPIITNLVRNYNLTFNILKAQIYPRKEGMVVLELRGNRDDFQAGVQYLKQHRFAVHQYLISVPLLCNTQREGRLALA